MMNILTIYYSTKHFTHAFSPSGDGSLKRALAINNTIDSSPSPSPLATPPQASQDMAVAEGKTPCRSRSTPAMKALLGKIKGKAFIMRLSQQNPEDDCIWDRNFLKTYSDVMSSQGDFEGVNPVQSLTDEFGTHSDMKVQSGMEIIICVMLTGLLQRRNDNSSAKSDVIKAISDVINKRSARLNEHGRIARCGPFFVHAKCGGSGSGPVPDFSVYCNEDTGRCDNTEEYRDAQLSTAYDFRWPGSAPLKMREPFIGAWTTTPDFMEKIATQNDYVDVPDRIYDAGYSACKYIVIPFTTY